MISTPKHFNWLKLNPFVILLIYICIFFVAFFLLQIYFYFIFARRQHLLNSQMYIYKNQIIKSVACLIRLHFLILSNFPLIIRWRFRRKIKIKLIKILEKSKLTFYKIKGSTSLNLYFKKLKLYLSLF